MKKLLVCLLLATAAWAQTKTDATTQMQVPSAAATGPILLLAMPGTAAWIVVQLDSAGFTIDKSTTPPTVRVTVPAAPQWSEFFSVRNSDGTWTMPQSCQQVRVFRNGFLQRVAWDYSTNGSPLTLRFQFGSNTTDPSEAADTVTVECLK